MGASASSEQQEVSPEQLYSMIRLADHRFQALEETVARVEQKIDALPRDEQLLEKIDGIRELVVSSREAVLDEVIGAMEAATEHGKMEVAVEAAQTEA